MGGEGGGGKGAEIGDVGEFRAVEAAEILLPEARIGLDLAAGEQGGGGGGAAPGRAGQHPVGGGTGQGGETVDARGDIGAADEASGFGHGGVADQQKIGRGVGLHRPRASQILRLMVCQRKMGKSILITGGARSGKSALAERMALSLGARPIYVATAEARDAEMAARIAAHRDRRGNEWALVEAPTDLAEALDRSDTGPRLVDCLTLWLSNLMAAGADWEAAARDLARRPAAQAHPVIFVTNEVGSGIVPDNALARRFRDAAGKVNQIVAEAADEVHLCVAGQALKVKPPHAP